jgi:hypothetical protein
MRDSSWFWLMVSWLSLAAVSVPIGCTGPFSSCLEKRTCGGSDKGGGAGGEGGDGTGAAHGGEAGDTSAGGGETGATAGDGGAAGERTSTSGGSGGGAGTGGVSDTSEAGRGGGPRDSVTCVFDSSLFGSGCVFGP